MKELRFEVVIDPKANRIENALAFGDFEADGTSVVYPSNGLAAYFTDLIMGRPMPLRMVVRSISDIPTLVGVTLFLRRDVALHATTPALVTAAVLSELGVAGLAHIDRDLSRFFKMLVQYLPDTLGRRDQQERLATAVGWICSYVHTGALEGLGRGSPVPRVLDHGEDGFVVAEVPGKALEDGWEELYRMGFLRGVLFGKVVSDRTQVLCARKGPYQRLDLDKAAGILNEAERAMGEPPSWEASSLWLRSPPKGTLLPQSEVLRVLVRV